MLVYRVQGQGTVFVLQEAGDSLTFWARWAAVSRSTGSTKGLQ